MVAADRRVAVIGYRLGAANLTRCSYPGFSPGLVLQAVDQYPRAFRNAAVVHFGLDNHVTVSAIVPDSPAERGGLRVGDAILAVEKQPTAIARLDGRSASYGTVSAALDLIERQARSVPKLTLTVRRQRQTETHVLPVAASCAIRVQLIPSPEINGFADDRYATITTGLERYTKGDDDALALFLGHELAHAYLRHGQVLRKSAPLHGLLGNALVPSSVVLRTERAADRLGLILAARAGYDITKAPLVWQRLGSVGRDSPFSRTHPGTTERFEQAIADVRDLRRKQAQGQPL